MTEDNENLTKKLERLKSTENVDDASLELTALISAAARDEQPAYTLPDIYSALIQTETSTLLDPLHVVPLLLDADNLAAGDILALTGECGSAKETLIAVQEALERLVHRLSVEDEPDTGQAFVSLERLLLLCISTIPRLKLRKRSPSETLKSLLSILPSAVELVAPNLSERTARQTITLVCTLLDIIVACAACWENGSDVPYCRDLCKSILLSTLSDLDPYLHLSLARQRFAVAFPRIASLNRTRAEIDDDNPSGLIIQTISEKLHCDVESLLDERSSGALVAITLLTRPPNSQTLSNNTTLSTLLPLLVSSLQSASGVDASLAILLTVLYPSGTIPEQHDIDPDLIPPLVYALVPFSCTSPDPQTRLIAFRILGALIACAPPLERMGILRELLTDEAFPALRVASVGLLKDAILRAFSQNQGPRLKSSPFSSPELLRTFGYIVLRPRPSNLFSEPATIQTLTKFLDTEEPKRLIECLSFYNVLLKRDVTNATGVHEASQIRSTEKELIAPLKASLQAWKELDLDSIGHHPLMVVAALETSLGRIDDALHEMGHSKPQVVK